MRASAKFPLLAQVELQPSDINIRKIEKLQLTLASVDIPTDEPAGTIRFTPIFRDS